MTEREPLRKLLIAVTPGLLAVAAALLTAHWHRPPAAWGLTLILAGLAVVASLHGPAASRGLGLGAVVLPAAIGELEPLNCVVLVLLVLFARQLVFRWVASGVLPSQDTPIPWLQVTAAAGRWGLATFVTAAAWQTWGGGESAGLFERGWIQLLAIGGLWIVLVGGLAALQASMLSIRGWFSRLWPELGTAGLGWLMGSVVHVVVVGMGWTLGLVLLGLVAVLLLEVRRQTAHRRAAEVRLRDFKGITGVVHRMSARQRDIKHLAEQARLECGRVIPFEWFQFELLARRDGPLSWWSRRSGELEEGAPEPPPSPPPLPGIHKRMSWQVLERNLRAQGEMVARLRLWCDPRRVDPATVDLLETLVPQLAASVYRALLEREAEQDALTGLPGRRSLEARLVDMFHEARQEGLSMAVVMCDLDHFKKVNDTYGHAAGDRGLQALAQLLEQHRRDTDLCCRFGGEEFTILLQGDGVTALNIAERLRSAVEEFELVVDGHTIPLTLSSGVAAFPELYVAQAEELLVLADEALYEAKDRGRNRCLLLVGPGRFRTVDGNELTREGNPVQQELPTIFA